MNDFSSFKSGWVYTANVVDEDGDVVCDGHFYRYLGNGRFVREADLTIVSGHAAQFVAAAHVAGTTGRLQ
jgi:hypothetical protein